MIRLEAKLPAETRNYRHDWSDFLGADTIASQVTASSDVTISGAAIVPTGDLAGKAIDFVASGGTVGETAIITQTITTAAGLIETETFALPIAADEPVSLTEAKAYLRVFSADEDAKILSMISRARGWVEDFTGLALAQRQFTELRRTERNAIRLFKAPLKSVDSTTYGAAQTYTPRVLGGQLVAAVDTSWPILDEYDAFEITYTAGFDAGTVPDELIGAMLALIEGEFSSGAAYPEDAVAAAERCCTFKRTMVA